MCLDFCNADFLRVTVHRSYLAPLHAILSGLHHEQSICKESDESDDDLDLEQPAGVPPGTKNYITPAGHQRLRDELLHLLDVERPEVVKLLSWAASNGRPVGERRLYLRQAAVA